MPRKRFNWKLAIVLLIGLAVLGITAYGLRQWQKSRRAEHGLILGNEAYDQGRWEEAASQLGRYLSGSPNDVTTLFKYADAQLNIRPLKRNNVLQAIAAYRTILRTDKSNTEAALKLAQIYLGMGMPGETELITSRVLESSQSPELRRMLAIALIQQRKFKEATKELENIIKEHPEQIPAYEILGRLIEQRPEDFSQAPMFWLDQAVKNNPSLALAYIIRAGFYLRTDEKTKALTDLEQAQKHDLSDTAVRLRLAREFINANIPDKAQTHLASVQNTEPTNQALWQTWAQLALNSGSKEIMLNVAETGLKELSSQPWDFMPVAAELYIRCDELDRAGDLISKLRQKDIAPATTAFLEGFIADKKGDGYEAVKCWNRAIQMGDKSDRTRLALAAVLSRQGDNQSAAKQLRMIVSEQPNLFGGRINLARLLIETGNWAEAAEQALVAKQISPASIDAALLYVQARIQLLQQSQTDKDSPMWRDVENQLSMLEKATDGALEVKLLQFRLAMQRRDLAAAEALVNKLEETNPSQIKVDMAKAELLAGQERVDEAVLMLNNTVAKFPEAVESVRYLAILLARQDKREKCEAVIKDAFERIKQPIALRELYFLLADLYDHWGQQEKAYELLNLLVQKLPDDISVKQRLLMRGQVGKNPEKAQQIVNDIKDLEGENGWQWRYEQARVWFSQDSFKERYPQIISLLKENLLANPDDQASRLLLAYSYEQAGELQLAVSTYREALNRSPQDIRIIVPTVAALYKTNEYDTAEEILRRAASEKLSHPELKRLELQSHLRRSELSSAGDILEDLLANDPDNRSIGLSLALLEIRQNRFAEADALLARLKVADPNSLPVMVARIESNIRQAKSAEAITLCDEIISKFNNASAYILRGRTYAMLGQPDKAEKDFEYATTIESNSAGTWAVKSDFYRSMGRTDAAITSIQKAVSIDPETIGIQKRAVSLFLASGDRQTVRKGRNILDKALTANPQDIELRLYKAHSLLAEGTAPGIEQAKGVLQKITEEQPQVGQAWAALSEIAIRQGQPARAMDIALRGLAYLPNDKSLILLKAGAEALRSPALAIPTLKALQELYPNDADTAIYLANTYIAAGDCEKAIALLRKQLASCGEDNRRKYNTALIVALYKNGNKDEAKKEVDSLLLCAPDDPAPLLALAALLRDDQHWAELKQKAADWCQKHPKDTNTPVIIAGDLATTNDSGAKQTAEDILKITLENNPDCTEAMNVRAILLQVTGRFAESAALYQKILTLQPDNVVAMNNLAWILCTEQGKYQQALEMTRRGLQIAPEYIDLIDTRGVAYYWLGQFDKAVQDFTRCLSLYPEGTPASVASHLHLGKALAKLGQKDKAVEGIKKALELNSKTGSLSAADCTEAQRLLEELLPMDKFNNAPSETIRK